ncbi:MAG: hypothetical protein LUE24_11855 [Lachnospiraceae bacterium]|nr:hypothetical protein [Lachnospiraceae bacterium]
MKTRKTRTDTRNTFTYKFADGTSVVLTPGVDGVTEADIAMLHRLDDCEVYNNVKHSKPPIQDWERESIERWKETHPDEDVPARAMLSLDVDSADDSMGGDKEKDTLLNLIQDEDVDCVSAETQAVRDFVDAYLTEEQQEIYQRVLIEEESMASVARDLGITRQSVRDRVNYIKKVFRENYKNF